MTATTEEPVRKFKRPLPVELTDKESIAKGRKAGALKKAIAKVKKEMKDATADHKEQLKQHQANLDGILDDLETGTEIRQVECFERKDYKRRKVEVVRSDLEGKDAILETRAMDFGDGLPAKPTADAATNGAAKEDEDDDEEGPDLSAPAPAAKRGRGRPRKEARA